MSSRLIIGPRLLARIERHARIAYPAECCGVLVGSHGDPTVVASVHPTPNRHPTRSRDRYVVDPGEILRLERAARAQGRGVIGFYHSHPDHPPAPSPTDTAQAWPGYLYLIVAVAPGRRAVTRAWAYDEQSSRFREGRLEAAPSAVPDPLATATHPGGEPEPCPSK